MDYTGIKGHKNICATLPVQTLNLISSPEMDLADAKAHDQVSGRLRWEKTKQEKRFRINMLEGYWGW